MAPESAEMETEASGKGPAVEEVLETFRTTESTRRNAIKNTDYKLAEEDRRVKEDQRLGRAEAAKVAEALRRTEAKRAAEEAKRRAVEEEAKRRAAEAARQAQMPVEYSARKKRKRRLP